MIEVFRTKLENHKKKIRKLIKNRTYNKKERDFLKTLLKEAKRLKKLIKQFDQTLVCPHCGKEI